MATAANQLRLTTADLKPAEGVFDAHDATIISLCDNSFVTEDITSGAERFCHQLRSAANADTVYLCSRSTLAVTATTSAANDVNNEDTQAIHQALLSMVADLSRCSQAVRTPDIRVFPDQAKMTLAIVPVNTQTLVVIADPDDPYRNITRYLADAIIALYHCQCDPAHEGFAPTVLEIQKYVLDALNRRYQPVSPRLAKKRLTLFADDLTALDIAFEKLIEPQPTGHPVQWGWEAVPVHPSNHVSLEQLRMSAAEWPPHYQFQTELDLCVLRKAAYGYKSLCESSNLQRFSDIKPLCINVSLQSLQQARYTNTLRELLERCVIVGSHVVFEVRESTANHSIADTLPAGSLEQIVALLKELREEFGLRFLLSDKVLRRASLTTLLALEPDYIKVDHFISKAGVQPVGALLDGFSLLADTRAVADTDTSLYGSAVVPPATEDAPMETEHEAVSY